VFDLEENRQKVQRALLLGIQQPDMSRQETEYLLDELAELTTNLDIPIVDRIIVKLRKPSPPYLLGKGKREEIIELTQEKNIDVIIFDEELTPAQQRNWER
jgi:GTP-binding protein HflX